MYAPALQLARNRGVVHGSRFSYGSGFFLPLPTTTPVSRTLDGVVFVKGPVFPTGSLQVNITLVGVVFVKPPTFPTGVISEPVQFYVDITNVPGNFLLAVSAKITVRYQGVGWTTGTVFLHAQLFRSDETTIMSDEVVVATVSSTTTWANSAQILFTNLDTSASKAVWNSAKVRFRWSS